MTKPVVSALKELKKVLFEMGIFASLVDSLLVLLAFVLVFMLILVPWYYALIPFAVYFCFHHIRKLKEASLPYVEGKFPDLKEQLITVADNTDKENEVVQRLNSEVLHKMKVIKTSSFLTFPRLYREIIVMTFLSFIIIGISAYNIHLLNYKDLLGRGELKIGDYNVDEQGLAFEEGNEEDILGEESIAELGNKELVLQINPVLSDVDLTKIEDVKEREFSKKKPTEIAPTTDSSYEESIPKNYQDIVKRYFGGITKYR